VLLFPAVLVNRAACTGAGRGLSHAAPGSVAQPMAELTTRGCPELWK
jgi:hypothetical protein